ncbi:MAG: hypothetical protein ACRD18_16395 [Terriglobia bacterium]
MGKNKDAKKIIKGIEHNIWNHKLKIENELHKDFPNQKYLAHWRIEIEVGEERITRLKRRMRKEA